MVRGAAELHRELQQAFDVILHERLATVPESERAALAFRLRHAFATALERAPSREDIVGDLNARAMLASAVDAVLARADGTGGVRAGDGD